MTTFEEDWEKLPDWAKQASGAQLYRICVDFARYDLQFFSEWTWKNVAGQVKNAPMHEDWYRLLNPKHSTTTKPPEKP